MNTRPPAARTAARLDELRAQAQFARQRYDLYKARAYGPHLTSPGRLRELERECTRAEDNLRFAQDEARRAATESPATT
ncbi:MAG: hypothetical protein WBQ18_14105 [Solirubrobacteraceae bacterium]